MAWFGRRLAVTIYCEIAQAAATNTYSIDELVPMLPCQECRLVLTLIVRGEVEPDAVPAWKRLAFRTNGMR
jgi:hypothetical protein